MRYRVRERQLMPGDDWFMVVWVDDPGEVEGVRATRELAEALAARLEQWADGKPLDDLAPSWVEPGDLTAIVERFDAVEPSSLRLIEYRRARMLAAQDRLAA